MDTVSERVAWAIQHSPYKKTDLAAKLDVTYHTILRWGKGNRDSFKESELEKLSEVLGIRKNWFLFGGEDPFTEPGLNLIKSAVNSKGGAYKGADQTISKVESRVKSLKRDLEAIEREMTDLRQKFQIPRDK